MTNDRLSGWLAGLKLARRRRCRVTLAGQGVSGATGEVAFVSRDMKVSLLLWPLNGSPFVVLPSAAGLQVADQPASAAPAELRPP